MAKAPPPSMAPDKALMTLAAHKPPPPPIPRRDPFTFAPIGQSGSTFTIYDPGDNWVPNYLTTTQHTNVKFGNGLNVQSDSNFDEETKVAMSVGKDGHLWLKINDQWKRIVTE